MVETIRANAEMVVTDLAVLRLLADPLRLRFIAAVADEPLTVKEVAARVGVAPGKLYYHVDLLERHGLLIVADQRVVSGITEKRYLAAARRMKVDRKLLAFDAPDETLDAMLAATLDATRSEAERVARSGALSIGDDDVLMTRLNVRTTPEGARKLRTEIDALIARVNHESDRSSDAFQYNLTLAWFPLTEKSA